MICNNNNITQTFHNKESAKEINTFERIGVDKNKNETFFLSKQTNVSHGEIKCHNYCRTFLIILSGPM